MRRGSEIFKNFSFAEIFKSTEKTCDIYLNILHHAILERGSTTPIYIFVLMKISQPFRFMLLMTTRAKMVLRRLLLVLVTTLALFLFYWFVPHYFTSKQAISLDEYKRNKLSARNRNGAWRGIKSNRSIDFRQQWDSVLKYVKIRERARLHLIIQFPVLNTSSSKSSITARRQKEFIFCLQQNLLSTHVQEIHILCESDQDPSFIRALALSMDWKLVFQVLGRRMRYKDAFQYASQNLLGKCTMIINADCYVAKGFEYLNEDLLSLKTLYALTRHETFENVNFCKKIDFCGPNSKYIGSHDAWLFKLLAPVPAVLLANIDFRPNIAGIERVLIFYLRKYGRFRIKNPCKILHIVHHHCNRNKNTKERLYNGQRIDHHFKITALNRGRTVNAPFSDL